MYSLEETQQLGRLWDLHPDVDLIAKQLNRSPRSVRAKLVRLGLYRPAPPPPVQTKKLILKEISDRMGEDMFGLEPAAKPTLQTLLGFLRNLDKKIGQST